MFKVESSAEAKESGRWDITHVETGEVVANISTYHYFRSSVKQLMVNDKVICDIKNQKEALEKLEEFFKNNAEATEAIQSQIDELYEVCENIDSPLAIGILQDFASKLEKEVVKLKELQLVDI